LGGLIIMGLHGNGSRFTQGSHVILGAANNAVTSRGNWNKPASEPNRFMGNVDQKTAVPDGYGIGVGTWAPAIKTGGASTRYQIQGTATLSGSGAAGIAASAALSGSGSLTALDTALAIAVADLVGSGSLSGSAGASVEAQAALSGSGSLSATASAVVNALADLAGSGALSAFATALTSAQAALSGSGGLVADASAGFNSVAALQGSGSMVPTASAIAHAVANLSVGAPVDPLSPTALARAVWNAFVVEFQGAGTFGEAIGQGSAGLSQQQIRDAMKLAASAGAAASGSVDQIMLDIYRLLGLDPTRPLIVTPTSVDAGPEISQTYTEAGSTITVERQ
jgi:hypothetical protein